MKLLKKLFSILLTIALIIPFINNKAVFAMNNNEQIENVITTYFNNELLHIKNSDYSDSLDIIVDGEFKNYVDLSINTKVDWYKKIEKNLIDFKVYLDFEDISQYNNNTYLVQVNVGHDLIFEDSSDITQKMRNESHIMLIKSVDDKFYIENDVKKEDIDEINQSLKNNFNIVSDNKSNLNEMFNLILKRNSDFINDFRNNINEKVTEYKNIENRIKFKKFPSAIATLSSGYNRQRAVDYARDNYNVQGSNQCTKFVSECLNAGGLSQTSMWKPGSSAWINVGLFYDYFVTASNRAYESDWSNNIGDVVQFGRSSVNWNHSTIITYIRPNTGEVFLTARSNPRVNYAYYNYMAEFNNSRFIRIY